MKIIIRLAKGIAAIAFGALVAAGGVWLWERPAARATAPRSPTEVAGDPTDASPSAPTAARTREPAARSVARPLPAPGSGQPITAGSINALAPSEGEDPGDPGDPEQPAPPRPQGMPYRPAELLRYSDAPPAPARNGDDASPVLQRILDVTQASPDQQAKIRDLWSIHEDRRRELLEAAFPRKSGPPIPDAHKLAEADLVFEAAVLNKVLDARQRDRLIAEIYPPPRRPRPPTPPPPQ